MIPVRCYTCGMVIANKWEQYKSHLEEGMKEMDAFNILGMKRYCCRRMFASHVELIDKVLLYSENIDKNSG